MANVKFSTEEADYIFDGVNHFLARRPDDLFIGIDALVIEPLSGLELKFIPEGLRERSWFVSFFGNSKLLQQLKKERTPVFSVDVQDDDIDVGYLLYMPSWRYYWYSALYDFSKRRIPDHVQKYMSDINHMKQNPYISGRSAISAEKILNHLVDRIKRERGISGRRVRIGLLYGAAHIDIVDYLTSDERRTEALVYHQKSGFKGLMAEDLDVITQYQYVTHDKTYNSAGWSVKRGNTGLFENNRLRRLST